jgi:capsular polysaccharide transport system permease protein
MSVFMGLFEQNQVVHALILRETRTRFGAHYLGYLWAFIEPILWILTFYGLFYLSNRTGRNGMDSISFLTTGIVPYQLFRETTGRSMAAINANRALLFYPHIRPLDLIISRTILEAVTYVSVFSVLLGLAALLQSDFVFNDPINTLAALMLASLLGASLGLVLCSLSVFSNSIERFIGPILRPLFWVSGVFFTANDLPTHYRELILWNPVLHIVEFVRDSWFASYQARYLNLTYVYSWILGCAFLGLILERFARRRLEVT